MDYKFDILKYIFSSGICDIASTMQIYMCAYEILSYQNITIEI